MHLVCYIALSAAIGGSSLSSAGCATVSTTQDVQSTGMMWSATFAELHCNDPNLGSDQRRSPIDSGICVSEHEAVHPP
jgi:hypothetical protein